MNRVGAVRLLAAAVLALGTAAACSAEGQSEEFLREVDAALTDPRTPPARLRWAGRVAAGLAPEKALALLDRAVARGGWAARREAAESLALVDHPERESRLRELARDASWAVRGAALASLRRLGTDPAFEAALESLADPVWSVRWQAVRSLAAFPPAHCTPDARTRRREALLRALDDGDHEVREEARRVLLGRPEPRALACYLELFDRRDAKNPDVERKAHAAARALLTLGGDEVRAALRERLGRPDLGTRILAARILQLLGEDLSPRLETASLVDDILAAWSEAPGAERAAAENLAYSLGAAAARAALSRLERGADQGALDEITSWIVDCLGAGDPPPAEEIAALATLELPAPTRRALVRSLARLDRDAPREPLEAAYREELALALRRHEQGNDDAGAGLRTDLFGTLIVTMPFPGWEDLIRTALDDPVVHVRRLAALTWVRRAGPEKPYGELAHRLAQRSSDHFGRDFLGQVARLGDDATFDFLMALAQGTYSDRAKLRLVALNALTSVTWTRVKRNRLVDWLRRRLAQERDPDARIRMLMLLGNLDMERALDLVAGIALDPAERIEVRIQAVNKLGAHRKPSAAPPLRTLLDRPDRRPDEDGAAGETERLKAAAQRALFALALPADRDRMLQVLTVGPERTRRLALVGLEQLRDPSTCPAVEAMVANGLVEPDNRARGLRVLAAAGGRDVADFLLKQLREATLPELRLGALEALALLDPSTYEERLLHYLSVLEQSRGQDLTARDRFAEFLGELGKLPSRAVTDFLIDFLLHRQSRPEAVTALGTRRDPLQVAARAALLGQGPRRVQPQLNASLDARRTAGPGLGLSEEFYVDLIELFTHPTRRAAWSALAMDLGRRVLLTAPAGSRQDARCLKFEAERTLEAGDFARAAVAYAELHRLVLVEGYFEREEAPAAITDDSVSRYQALAAIAGALDSHTPGAEDVTVRSVAAGVEAAPHDGPTLIAGVQALARIGAGFEQAEDYLVALGPRGHGDVAAALARYDLAVALIRAGRPAAGAAELRTAVRDHRPLRRTAAGDPDLRAALGEQHLAELLGPMED